jgi:hypothetical protein
MADVEKRVVALETEMQNLKKSFAADLKTFKKAFNFFTKDMRDTETHFSP